MARSVIITFKAFADAEISLQMNLVNSSEYVSIVMTSYYKLLKVLQVSKYLMKFFTYREIPRDVLIMYRSAKNPLQKLFFLKFKVKAYKLRNINFNKSQ